MKRILFIARNLNSGGAERQMVSLASLLKDKGYDVSFVCFEKGDFFVSVLNQKCISVNWLIRKSIFGRLFSYRKFIRKGKFDVVISFLETPNILNCFAALGNHSWRVITGERSAKQDLMINRRGKIVAQLQRRSDAIVCNSLNSADLWRRYYPFLNTKIITIYNLVLTKSSVSHYLYNPNRIRIVVAASYQYLKNPLNVVKGVALLSDEEKSRIQIDWYGNPIVFPSAFKETVTLIKDYHLDNNIVLHMATKNIHQEMLSADFVGLFSSVEGLPNAICEAMSLGKPIIFSRVSDYKVLVQNNGLLCDGNDPESIRDVLKIALSLSSSEVLEMGKQSRCLARSLFSEDVIIKKWEWLINS